jgi:hypothetical protein
VLREGTRKGGWRRLADKLTAAIAWTGRLFSQKV